MEVNPEGHFNKAFKGRWGIKGTLQVGDKISSIIATVRYMLTFIAQNRFLRSQHLPAEQPQPSTIPRPQPVPCTPPLSPVPLSPPPPHQAAVDLILLQSFAGKPRAKSPVHCMME